MTSRAHHAREQTRRREIANAARTYERALAIRESLARQMIDAKKRGEDCDDLKYQWRCVRENSAAAFNVLAACVDTKETVKVDGILYYKAGRDALVRLNPADYRELGGKA